MSKPLTGQVAVTASAQTLAPGVGPVAFLAIKAPVTNAFSVWIGDTRVTTATGHQLDPGEVFEYERRIENGRATFEITPNDFAVIGTAGDRVTWFASP